MSEDKRAVVSLSLPSDLVQRIDTVVQMVSSKRSFGRITRSSLIRSALERGLDQIEVEIKNG